MPEQLVDLLYGELNAEAANAVEAHLKDCPACTEAWAELQSTTKIMAQWEDIAPERRHHFVEQRLSPIDAVRDFLRRHMRLRQMAWGIPAAAAALLILLSLTNFEAEYKNGEWRVAFGTASGRTETQTPEAVTTAMKQMQQETLLLVSQILDESETRQKSEVNRVLAHYATESENRRQNDLKLMGQGLEGLQLTTQNRLNQNRKAISDLLELASYSLDRK